MGEVKNNRGNGEAKELTCSTHGHELRGEWWWEWGAGQSWRKGRKKWDNYNSIMNKIYLKKTKTGNKGKNEVKVYKADEYRWFWYFQYIQKLYNKQIG